MIKKVQGKQTVTQAYRRRCFRSAFMYARCTVRSTWIDTSRVGFPLYCTLYLVFNTCTATPVSAHNNTALEPPTLPRTRHLKGRGRIASIFGESELVGTVCCLYCLDPCRETLILSYLLSVVHPHTDNKHVEHTYFYTVRTSTYIQLFVHNCLIVNRPQ